MGEPLILTIKNASYVDWDNGGKTEVVCNNGFLTKDGIGVFVRAKDFVGNSVTLDISDKVADKYKERLNSKTVKDICSRLIDKKITIDTKLQILGIESISP